MRSTALCLAMLLAAGPSGSPFVRLASSVADALIEGCKGRSLEIETPEDRTGRGAGFALDIRGLVLEQLAGRATLAGTGPRLRVSWVLSETPDRLLASARLTEEPEGRLVDMVSVSVATDRSVLALSTTQSAATARSVDIVPKGRTVPLEAPVLDIGLLDEERFLVLYPDALALHRWDGSALRIEARQALRGPFTPVRGLAGLISVSVRDSAAWILTNRSEHAALYAVEGPRLLFRQEAEAVPWPGSRTGLRFRPGTDWLDGSIDGLGTGPFLRVTRGESRFAVLPDGRILAPPRSIETRAGSAAATLWPGLLAVSSADPPSARDRLLLIDQHTDSVADTLSVDGTIRALGALVQGATARIVLGLLDTDGQARLEIIDLKRLQP